jgi:hypothetical protein
MPENLDDKQVAAAPSAEANGDNVASPATNDDKTLAQVVAEAASKHVSSSDTPGKGEDIEDKVEDQNVQTNKVPTEDANGKDKPAEGQVKSPEDPDAKLPFSKHPRWQEVIKQRNEARTEVEELRKLKPQAEVAQRLNKFCADNGVSDQDLQVALEIAALAKKDLKAFRARIGEMADHIDFSLGQRLPDDLQAKVKAGTMSEEDAKEVARLRMADKNNKTSAAERQREQELASQRQAQQAMENMTSALNGWEATKKASDLDWDTIRPLLKDRLSVLWVAQKPRTPEAVVALAEEALKDVKVTVKSFMPAKARQRPALDANTSTNGAQPTLKLDNLKTDLAAIVRAVAGGQKVLT